jgi:hypothetical protein
MPLECAHVPDQELIRPPCRRQIQLWLPRKQTVPGVEMNPLCLQNDRWMQKTTAVSGSGQVEVLGADDVFLTNNLHNFHILVVSLRLCIYNAIYIHQLLFVGIDRNAGFYAA